MQYILLEYADLISNKFFLRHLMIISSDPDKKISI